MAAFRCVSTHASRRHRYTTYVCAHQRVVVVVAVVVDVAVVVADDVSTASRPPRVSPISSASTESLDAPPMRASESDDVNNRDESKDYF